MKRKTTLTVIMMLCSVAAAVAAPETPSHKFVIDCLEPQQLAAVGYPVATLAAAPERKIDATPVSKRSAQAPNRCDEDITAPYRRLHHGGMKLPAACTTGST